MMGTASVAIATAAAVPGTLVKPAAASATRSASATLGHAARRRAGAVGGRRMEGHQGHHEPQRPHPDGRPRARASRRLLILGKIVPARARQEARNSRHPRGPGEAGLVPARLCVARPTIGQRDDIVLVLPCAPSRAGSGSTRTCTCLALRMDAFACWPAARAACLALDADLQAARTRLGRAARGLHDGAVKRISPPWAWTVETAPATLRSKTGRQRRGVIMAPPDNEAPAFETGRPSLS